MNKQQAEILAILKTAGTNGMNSYQWRMKYIQLPVRIKELKEQGYLITTRKNKNRSVDYILISEPQGVKKPTLPVKMTYIPYTRPDGEKVFKEVPVDQVKPEQLHF